MMWGLIISAVCALITAAAGGLLGWVLCRIMYQNCDDWDDGYEHGFRDGKRDAE